MSIEVRRFQAGDEAGVAAFNDRFEAAGIEHRLWEEDLDKNPDADLERFPVSVTLHVVSDGDAIRGGSWLREQYFWANGERHRVGWMKYPVAESLIDPKFAGVPASMVIHLLRRQPNLMALGMGGHDAPFARLLKGIRWQSSTVPFFFRVVRPFRVLRGLAYARRKPLIRLGADVAAFTGVGAVAHAAYLAAHRLRRRDEPIDYSVEPAFGPWADETWLAARDEYRSLAVRDAHTLNYQYGPRFIIARRIRVTRAGRDIGWACAYVLSKRDANKSYFGQLNVGLITDALARPEDAADVIRAGVQCLEAEGADIVLSYFSHSAWTDALRRLAFVPGPSTFAFYRSPHAEKTLVDGPIEECFLTRSDGDGPTY